MSQFDETTKRKAHENEDPNPENFYSKFAANLIAHRGFTVGRNSTKESMEMLARAAKDAADWNANPHQVSFGLAAVMDDIVKAIDAVKARGDWPLGDA